MHGDLEDVYRELVAFRTERDWQQFHTPKNLACSISIEAGELLENFQWSEGDQASGSARERIRDEIADVGIYLLLLAGDMGIDLVDAMREKMETNRLRYPAERNKGVVNKPEREAGT
jgi:NTP pyrophosphatase (non-canonical NTP hydrolase)